jgi:hypothetical protein
LTLLAGVAESEVVVAAARAIPVARLATLEPAAATATALVTATCAIKNKQQAGRLFQQTRILAESTQKGC